MTNAPFWETPLLILRTAVYFLVFLVPGAAGCIVAVKRGERDLAMLGIVGLISTGLTGFAAFWLWFLLPPLGAAFSSLFTVIAALYCVLTWRRLQSTARETLQKLRAPVLLVFGCAVFVICLGFVYGGSGDPLVIARSRFSHALPADNELPLMFASQIRSGHIRKPMYVDWSSSDRPPLQTGIVLSQMPLWAHPTALRYMIVGVVLQSLCIFGLWLCLRLFGLKGPSLSLSIAALVFSGFFIVNSFFVWPKLLASAYMLPAAGLLLSDKYRVVVARHARVAVMTGILLALGMLAHGGSAFAVIGLIATLVLLRLRLKLKPVLVVLFCCGVTYAPWILYQKLYDPPGDRLLKMHLAGINQVDARPFGQAFIAAYETAGWKNALASRESNLRAAFDQQQEFWAAVKEFCWSIASRPRRCGKCGAEHPATTVLFCVSDARCPRIWSGLSCTRH